MRWMIVAVLTLAVPTVGLGSPTVFASPPHVVVEEGEAFDMSVRVDAGTDTVTCFLVEFVFDGGIIGLTSADEGSLFADCGYETMFSWDVHDSGRHSCNDVTLGHWAYAICPGELVKLSFTALSPGGTPIEITIVDLRDINRDPIANVGTVEGFVSVLPGTGVDESVGVGSRLSLTPNPFRDALSIEFTSGCACGAAEVSVHDVAGRSLAAWTIRGAANGTVEAVWDGRDRSGSVVPSGIYFLVVRGAGRERRGRVVLLR